VINGIRSRVKPGMTAEEWIPAFARMTGEEWLLAFARMTMNDGDG
jgi:hypothetical protein